MTSSPSPARILLISSYYWPESAGNAPYVTGVAEHLAGVGYAVTVATGFPHYPEWKATSDGRFSTRERHQGVEIRRRWHYVPHVQSVLTRAVYEATLYAVGTTALPRQAPDAILAVSPTLADAALARTAATVYGRPYGLVFQDLQGLGATQSGVEGGRQIARLVERTEARLARDAQAVGVIAEAFRSYFELRGIPPERIHRLRNWARGAEPTEPIAETRRRLGFAETDFVCLHAGNMGHKQGLENVLHAAAAVTDPRVRVVLAGDGNERERLARYARRLELENVSFVPSQESGRYEAMLRAADVLIVNQRASVGAMSLASKLTSYFMSERPVIGAVAATSETARELRLSGAGIITAPDEPHALANAIRWMRDHPDEAQAFGKRGRDYAQRHLAAATVLAGYERLVEAVLNGRGHGRRQTRDG